MIFGSCTKQQIQKYFHVTPVTKVTASIQGYV